MQGAAMPDSAGEAFGLGEIGQIAVPVTDLERAVDRARRLELRLGRELVVMDAEQGEVVADQLEHRLDRSGPEEVEPLGFRGGGILVAIFGGELVWAHRPVDPGYEHPVGAAALDASDAVARCADFLKTPLDAPE